MLAECIEEVQKQIAALKAMIEESNLPAEAAQAIRAELERMEEITKRYE